MKPNILSLSKGMHPYIRIFTFLTEINFLSLNKCDIVIETLEPVSGKFLLQKKSGR